MKLREAISKYNAFCFSDVAPRLENIIGSSLDVHYDNFKTVLASRLSFTPRHCLGVELSRLDLGLE